jgi:hypothetical protein
MPAVAGRKPTCNPDTVSETLRAKSDYTHGTGYAPFYHAFLADLPRLCSGASCWALVLAVLMESLGRARNKGEAAPEWTKDLDKQWLTTVCHTDKRTVDRDLKYLEASGMAQVRHTIRGMVCIRLCYRDWPGLPDYEPPVKKNGPTEPMEDEAEPSFKLLKIPCHVKVGSYSEAIEITHPVTSFRLGAAGDADIAFTAEIRGGRFTVTTKAVSVSNDLRSAARHACPENTNSEQKAKWRTEGEHPRAGELAKLFDPILLRSCGRSLSADTAASSQALDALGDLPHDFLVKFVIQRAERPISSPKVCAAILKEAVANWRKAEALPDRKPMAAMTNSERVAHLRGLEAEQRRSGRR